MFINVISANQCAYYILHCYTYIQGVPSIIVGTICAIQEEEGWWYLGCRTCRKKLVKTTDIVDLENDTAPKASVGANEWWCSKCKSTVTTVKSQ